MCSKIVVLFHVIFPEDKIKNKWKGLVSTYEKEIEREENSLLNPKAKPYKSSWPHLQSMQYINNKSNDFHQNDVNVTECEMKAITKCEKIEEAGCSMEKKSTTQSAKYEKILNNIITTEEADWYYFLSLMSYVAKIKYEKTSLNLGWKPHFLFSVC